MHTYICMYLSYVMKVPEKELQILRSVLTREYIYMYIYEYIHKHIYFLFLMYSYIHICIHINIYII
jgi:hypothetical protein